MCVSDTPPSMKYCHMAGTPERIYAENGVFRMNWPGVLMTKIRDLKNIQGTVLWINEF